jgi:CPA1 family monovalent cation:H+ antiporter
MIGLAVAVASRFLLRVIHDPIAEAVMTVTAVYGSYSLASAVDVSGLVAVSITGISYGIIWATDEPRRHKDMLRSFWTILAFLANSIAFLAIGLATNLSQIIAFALPITVGYLVVLLARFVSVYSILGFVRIDRVKIPNSWKMVAALGGARGAISIVLVVTLPSTLEDGNIIHTMVLGVAFISIVLQGYVLTRYAKSKFSRNPKSSAEKAAEG